VHGILLSRGRAMGQEFEEKDEINTKNEVL